MKKKLLMMTFCSIVIGAIACVPKITSSCVNYTTSICPDGQIPGTTITCVNQGPKFLAGANLPSGQSGYTAVQGTASCVFQCTYVDAENNTINCSGSGGYYTNSSPAIVCGTNCPAGGSGSGGNSGSGN